MSMLKVTDLTKHYPGRLAVKGISFEVERGEVVGFLGPNGAGKSTTMRIITGYLSPSSGSVEVAGFNVMNHPMEVRRRVGYLPESCPLYTELRVNEYLKFRAELKGVSARRIKRQVDRARELCGLDDVGRRIISQLSKGYRQRVGLAETLLAEPDLLILDEPTVGLDPNQILHVRDLIKGLSEEHTILLSTHIMQEVEAVCERVLIIKDGLVVAQDTPEALSQHIRQGAQIYAELQAPDGEIRALESLPDVVCAEFSAQADGWRSVELQAKDERVRERVFALAVQHGWTIRELHLTPYTLEDVFVEVTREGAAQ